MLLPCINRGRMPSYEWTQVAFWKHPHLSYIVFIVISVLGGLLGLDHLYLRSPMTAGLKALSILVIPGFWWLYDILQATTEKDIFLKFGLNTPIIPSSGIGAGMFMSAESNNKKIPIEEKPPSPFWFISYIILAILPIGLDHLVVGDTRGGFLKLWLTVMLLFPLGLLILPLLLTPVTWAIAIFWSIYNWFRIYFRTDKLFTQGVSRFGIPGMEPYFLATGKLSSYKMQSEVEAAEEASKEQSKWTTKIPFLDDIVVNSIDSLISMLKSLPGGGHIVDLLLTAKDNTRTIAKGAIKQATNVANQVTTIVNEAPATGAAVSGIIQAGIDKKLKAVTTLSPLPASITQATGQATNAARLVTEGPAAASGIIQAGIDKKLEQALPVMTGGALVAIDNNFSYSTIGLIGIITIIATASIGKYLFNKYHPDKVTSMENAVKEQPPSRNDFAKEKEAAKGSDELPPEPVAKSVKAVNE